MKAAVIGSGIAGLAAALRLIKLGFQVSVFEQNSYPGGKIREIRKNNFRWDGGPSLFTMPWLVDELFELHDKNPRDYFEYKDLEIACKYFDQGEVLNAFTNPDLFANEVQQKLNVSQSIVKDYLLNADWTYNLTEPVFVNTNGVHPSKKSFSLRGAKIALNSNKIGAFKKLSDFNQKRLKHPLLQKIFNRYATYNGSNPYKTPAVLHCIASLEHGTGVAFPTKGIYNIVDALYKLAIEVGVNFHFNHSVQKVIKNNGLWAVDGNVYNKVVVNGDVYSSQKLFDKPFIKLPLKQKMSSSGVVFYWGVNKEFQELEVHNIFFAKDYKNEFKNIEAFKCDHSDLTIYIYISSKIVESDAPRGAENWFVMVNTAPDTSIGDNELKLIKQNVITRLNKELNVDLDSLIVAEEIMHPKVLEQLTSSYNGALYGMNSNSLGNMMERPMNGIGEQGIYFTGGSVFPGGGIPMCMLSAKNVEGLIKKGK